MYQAMALLKLDHGYVASSARDSGIIEVDARFSLQSTRALATTLSTVGPSFNQSEAWALLAAAGAEASFYGEALSIYASTLSSLSAYDDTQLALVIVVAASLVICVLCALYVGRRIDKRFENLSDMANTWFRGLHKLKIALENSHQGQLKAAEALLEQANEFEEAFKRLTDKYELCLQSHLYFPEASNHFSVLSSTADARIKQLKQMEQQLADAALFEEADRITALLRKYQDNDFKVVHTVPMDSSQLRVSWAERSSRYRQHQGQVLTDVFQRVLDMPRSKLKDFFARYAIFETSAVESLTRLLTRRGLNFTVDAPVLEALRQFTQSEFASENMNFWFAVEDFKSLPPGQIRIVCARDICDRFISEHGPDSVNVSAAMRQSILKAVMAWSADDDDPRVFNGAQSVALDLMAANSYDRFLTSEYAALLYSDLQEKEEELEVILKPLKEFQESLQDFAAEFCQTVVKAGNYPLAQELWEEGLRLFDGYINISLLDCRKFIEGTKKDHTEIMQLLQRRKAKKAKAINERLITTIASTKKAWVEAMFEEQKTDKGIITALLRLCVLRELEVLERRELLLYQEIKTSFMYELSAVDDDDDDDTVAMGLTRDMETVMPTKSHQVVVPDAGPGPAPGLKKMGSFLRVKRDRYGPTGISVGNNQAWNRLMAFATAETKKKTVGKVNEASAMHGPGLAAALAARNRVMKALMDESIPEEYEGKVAQPQPQPQKPPMGRLRTRNPSLGGSEMPAHSQQVLRMLAQGEMNVDEKELETVSPSADMETPPAATPTASADMGPALTSARRASLRRRSNSNIEWLRSSGGPLVSEPAKSPVHAVKKRESLKRCSLRLFGDTPVQHSHRLSARVETVPSSPPPISGVRPATPERIPAEQQESARRESGGKASARMQRVLGRLRDVGGRSPNTILDDDKIISRTKPRSAATRAHVHKGEMDIISPPAPGSSRIEEEDDNEVVEMPGMPLLQDKVPPRPSVSSLGADAARALLRQSVGSGRRGSNPMSPSHAAIENVNEYSRLSLVED